MDHLLIYWTVGSLQVIILKGKQQETALVV